MKPVKLSICIPTYNRKSKILAQLSRLLPQINKYSTNEVEVIVSDNCSSDGTSDELRELHIINQFELVTQSVNLGLVGNLYYLFEHARGEYVWFLSDDDILESDAVDSIMGSILSTNKDFYCLNFRLDTSPDRLYWNQTDDVLSLFESKTWGGFGLLSVQVLKKDAFRSFYNSTRKDFNLCQPVAVSLYGLFYLSGEILFNKAHLTHHVGDYSWASKEVEVNSVYLFQSVCLLKDYGDEELFKKILNKIVSSNFMAKASVRYMIMTKDKQYITALRNEGVFIRVLYTALKYLFKKKFVLS